MTERELTRKCGSWRAVAIVLGMIVIVFVAVVLWMHGQHADADEREVSAIQLEALYQSYLRGNVDQARSSLHDSIKILENSDLLPKAKAHGLYFVYSRLYVLERKAGHSDTAEACLVKARYWYLRKHELLGLLPTEAGAAVRSFTAEKILEFVEAWDMKRRVSIQPGERVP